jgi:protease I
MKKPTSFVAIISRFTTPRTWVLSIILLVGLAVLTSGDAIADESKGQHGDKEVAAIQATVFDYFEGINELDRARLESAFDTSAQLKSPDDEGAVKVEPIADAITRWMSGKAQQRKGKILRLEITDEQVAQVVFDYDGIFVDFLTLLKLDGQWKIVDKVFVPVPQK